MEMCKEFIKGGVRCGRPATYMDGCCVYHSEQPDAIRKRLTIKAKTLRTTKKQKIKTKSEVLSGYVSITKAYESFVFSFNKPTFENIDPQQRVYEARLLIGRLIRT